LNLLLLLEPFGVLALPKLSCDLSIQFVETGLTIRLRIAVSRCCRRASFARHQSARLAFSFTSDLWMAGKSGHIRTRASKECDEGEATRRLGQIPAPAEEDAASIVGKRGVRTAKLTTIKPSECPYV
jgi:hypothetical protein